jgi:hypothetical protein
VADKKKRRDKSGPQAGGEEVCDIEHFAQRNGISIEEAHGLLRQLGEKPATFPAVVPPPPPMR